MFGGYEVTYKGSPKISKKDIREFKKRTNQVIALHWHRTIMFSHFTPAGARKYSYARRKTKEVTTGRIREDAKGRKLAPSGNPLEWSGTSKRLARHPSLRKVTSKQARLTYPIKAFNFRPGGINMTEEFRRITKADEKAISKEGQKFLLKKLRRINKTVRVRITA